MSGNVFKVVKAAEQTNSDAEESIAYFTTKTFDRALQEAFLRGGEHRKKHDRAKVVLGSLRDPDPFATLSTTNHGESRIKNCVKYDLGGAWRLVTLQTAKTCTFLFMGDHDDTERWIEGHRGESVAIKDRRLVRVPGVGKDPEIVRKHLAEHHSTPLVDLLATEAMDYVLDGLPRSLVRKLEMLDGNSSAEELVSLIHDISDHEQAELVRVVFTLLMTGNVDGAQSHVDLMRGHISSVGDLGPESFIDIQDGDEVRRLVVGSAEYEQWLDAFEKRSSWHDWFLFLHPEQEKVVKADYAGTTQLSGVSGSGKTCVVVRRALRLAEADGSKVLLLTLNRSLAGLLRQLVDAACVDEGIRERIQVTSFFELAQGLLFTFEPENWRRYQDVTWKLEEHVDEVFREYYRRWSNNDEAKILIPMHKSFNARGVNGESYLREEFDWIRSAHFPGERTSYMEIDREGRKFPILAERRRDILLGLDGWERKMEAVGVIDYLGLTSALARHIDAIAPEYTHVLVDEAQDFGTTELKLIRRLVPPGSNDLFLCGDVAQTVLPKHRSLSDAGIVIATRERIQQNYRNSREILAAAYELLTQNLHEELFKTDGLEVLDPKFANFSGSAPIALAAETLEEEIAYARAYAETRLGHGVRTVCIAFAGFSARDIKAFADCCNVTALDGAYDPSSDRLVFSDLEQTKGYEFDTLVVVNCCEDVLPSKDAPEEEAFRDACKLYVAMTRAKRELVLSFNGVASTWIRAVGTTIDTDHWSTCEVLDQALLQGIPTRLPETEPDATYEDAWELTGRDFLNTALALGLSLEAQDKLSDVVDGKGLKAARTGRRLKWKNLKALLLDLLSSPRHDAILGPKVAEEIRSMLGSHPVFQIRTPSDGK